MTVNKKRTVSAEGRKRMSEARKAAWATRRARAAADVEPQPAPSQRIYYTFDPVTASNHALTISRAINHLSDYQTRLEREGFIGHPAEIAKTIVHLGDIGRLFRGQ